jgi:hypothetical protein
MSWALGCVAFVLIVFSSGEGRACQVLVDDPEVVFPVDKMDRQTLCVLAGVVNDHTTSRVMPPILTPIQKPVFDFLLDHMILTAALVRKLALGEYRIRRIGAQTFQGEDGLGAEAVFLLIYQDPTRRVYHIHGKHQGKVIPLITGEAIVMLTCHAKLGADGKEHVETRIVAYSRLDNAVLATLVKVFEPLLRGVVNDKLTTPFITVHRLGKFIARDAESVYRQVESVSDADKADMEALRALLLPVLKRER